MKSATENVGTFDAENPDIRYDLTDEEARKATEWEQALWDRAYEQAARNAENGQKNTAREGAGRYALDNIQKHIGAAMSDSERSAILKKRTFVPAEYAGQAEARVEAERDNLESGKKKLVKEALRRAADEFGALGMMNNADMELDVIVSHGSINESGQKQNGHEAELMRLMPVLREAVKGAVGIEIHDNRYFADNQTVRFVNLPGGYTTGNSFIPVRFGIKVQRNGRNTLYVMIAEDQIKKAEVVRTQVPKKSVYYAPRSAEINIAELAKKVKSASLLKYFPDGLLNQEQRIAKWKAVAETVAYTNSKNDERYKKYIKSGDKQNAGRMMQAAAEAAGYTIRAYHGTTNAEQYDCL